MHKDNNSWTTTRFVDPTDLRHDMHVNIVNFKPGGTIPFMETHVMEHGIYILQGKGTYRLNDDWVEVQAGDFYGLELSVLRHVMLADLRIFVTCFIKMLIDRWFFLKISPNTSWKAKIVQEME